MFALLLLVVLSPVSRTRAQESLPPLDMGAVSPVPAVTFASFPAKTFIENILVDDRGTLFVTSLEEGAIYRVAADGKPQEFAKIEGQVAGIAPAPKGGLFINGWARDKTPTIWRVSAEGVVSKAVSPSGAQFLNGFIRLAGDRYLIADSYLGAIWEFNAKTGAAVIWLKDPLLARSDPKNPFPAVNGLRIHQGILYASNTQRRLLLKIPLDKSGKPGSAPTVFVKEINLDDFAFDSKGNLYGTTHVYNTVVRIAPDGKITTIASAAQGVVGSTAAAFGRGKKDTLSLYVTTNGGMSNPPPEGIQPAKIVRLTIGDSGKE